MSKDKRDPPSSEYIVQEIKQYLKAYRTKYRIPFQDLMEAIGISQQQLEEQLINLIDAGEIQGLLEQNTLILYSAMIGHCQLCDRPITYEMSHYQCRICHRRLCTSCFSIAPTCPTHPQTHSKFIRLPITCTQCSKQIFDINQETNSISCPECQTQLIFETIHGIQPLTEKSTTEIPTEAEPSQPLSQSESQVIWDQRSITRAIVSFMIFIVVSVVAFANLNTLLRPPYTPLAAFAIIIILILISLIPLLTLLPARSQETNR